MKIKMSNSCYIYTGIGLPIWEIIFIYNYISHFSEEWKFDIANIFTLLQMILYDNYSVSKMYL